MPATRSEIGLAPWKSYSSHAASPLSRSERWMAATSGAMMASV